MRMAFRYANCMDLQGLSAESGNLRRCGKEAPAQQFTFRQRGENYEGRNPSTFVTGSTKPEIHVEVCSKCHSFYTGQQKQAQARGRIDKFNKKYGFGSEKQ